MGKKLKTLSKVSYFATLCEHNSSQEVFPKTDGLLAQLTPAFEALGSQ